MVADVVRYNRDCTAHYCVYAGPFWDWFAPKRSVARLAHGGKASGGEEVTITPDEHAAGVGCMGEESGERRGGARCVPVGYRL